VIRIDIDGEPVAVAAIAIPLRPEAAAAVARLREMTLRTDVLSGDSEAAVTEVARATDVDECRHSLSPAAKLEALEEMRGAGRRVAMVGDGINDAPALAGAEIGIAIGTGAEVARASSDVTLLGADLLGVPTAIGLARATRRTILQNFGWAMGYNAAALPLAALGLLDPVIAALAMGVSSLVVVLNSLRLRRFAGRSRAPKPAWRTLAGSFGLPLLVFSALTLAGQTVSPARGESLLPTVPTLTIVQLPGGRSVETYFDPGGRGLQQWHVIFEAPRSQLADTDPVVTASFDGSPPQRLRQVTLGPGHVTDFVVLTPGDWLFTVSSRLGTRTVTFNVAHRVK
jgi:soluble P-type ATPase